MLNEGKGISEIVKEYVNIIWLLFLNNSYSSHILKFSDKDLTINFNHINNYYSNITINKLNYITINIGIPSNAKENRVKENISHELTHVVEILGLNGKDYPRYNQIKLSLREFKNYSMTNSMEFITDVFYKTLDNEINANVAQTYIYIKSDGKCSKEKVLNRLKEWETYKLYDNIKNINLSLLISGLIQNEVDDFNDILIKNGVRTISSNNVEIWLNYWFKIFKRKSDIFIKNSERILKEVEKDWEIFENYVNNEYDSSKNIDYSQYISNFNDFNKNN
jgi:hypothetical protein